MLYREAWSQLVTRPLSTIPSATTFDDHDVYDRRTSSAAWVRTCAWTDWLGERIDGGVEVYLDYEHLATLTPDEIARHPLYRRSAPTTRPRRRTSSRPLPTARAGAGSAQLLVDGRSTRLVVIDAREGRVPQRRPPGDDRRRSSGAWPELPADRETTTTRGWPARCRSCSRRRSTNCRRGTRRSAPASGAPLGRDRSPRAAASGRLNLEHWAALQ